MMFSRMAIAASMGALLCFGCKTGEKPSAELRDASLAGAHEKQSLSVELFSQVDRFFAQVGSSLKRHEEFLQSYDIQKQNLLIEMTRPRHVHFGLWLRRAHVRLVERANELAASDNERANIKTLLDVVRKEPLTLRGTWKNDPFEVVVDGQNQTHVKAGNEGFEADFKNEISNFPQYAAPALSVELFAEIDRFFVQVGDGLKLRQQYAMWYAAQRRTLLTKMQQPRQLPFGLWLRRAFVSQVEQAARLAVSPNEQTTIRILLDAVRKNPLTLKGTWKGDPFEVVVDEIGQTSVKIGTEEFKADFKEETKNFPNPSQSFSGKLSNPI